MKIGKKVKSGKERRRRNRWQVAVLVRCSIPKFGDELFELEMWAKDVNEGGLRLELSRGLNISNISRPGENDSHQVRFDDLEFKKGLDVKIQDLFYDDDGSPFINGKISWARRAPQGGWDLGIQFTDTKKQSKALLGAFKDFLSIVKNPMDAIEKASRK